jgi:hypothetical protein
LNAGHANLVPNKPGGVLNPKGNNQWTYRREAEEHLAKWCKAHGKELIDKLMDEAAKGKPWAMKLALDRVLPVIHRHEIELPVVEEPALEAVLDRFLAQVGAQRVPAKPNGNGKALT